MKPTRNPEEIEQLKGRILEQALELIISGGLDALTMRKLAARTGMTAPNLYNYFNRVHFAYPSRRRLKWHR